MPESEGNVKRLSDEVLADAERKAALISALLRALKIPDEALIRAEYIDL